MRLVTTILIAPLRNTAILAKQAASIDALSNGRLTLGLGVGGREDDFLAAQGILEECEEQAVKQILADQIKAAMEKDRLTKAAMAIRMRTSRRALDRLLDPTNTSVTLHTLQRAAVAIGRQLRLELV